MHAYQVKNLLLQEPVQLYPSQAERLETVDPSNWLLDNRETY